MPRLILKCPYYKGGRKQEAHLKNYIRYISTRDGVEKISRRENYLEYISRRPHSHGLFTGTEDVLVLSRIAREVANHPGNIWLPILSLKREDAARLGYDNAQSWKTLLTSYAPEMAQAMKIPLENFRWYAAYHDEGTHPHVHMVCYSTDPAKGYLSKAGIEKMKSGLAGQIFRQKLTELYSRQTERRTELNREAQEELRQLVAQMHTGTLENQRIGQLMVQLARRLKAAKGKRQYGYLKAPVKALVDEIVDELERDERVAKAYGLWYELREEVLRTYRDEMPERLPLSRQKEFKRIRNIVIQEAGKLADLPEQAQNPSAMVLSGTIRLLHQLGNIFGEQAVPGGGMRVTVDHRLKRKMQAKKAALGHQEDDREPEL